MGEDWLGRMIVIFFISIGGWTTRLSKLNKYTLKICALYINFTSKEKAIIEFHLMISMLRYLEGNILVFAIYFEFHKKPR